MMNNELFDALETCMQEMESGASLEQTLARFPKLAVELRPILQAAQAARSLSAPMPSETAMRAGRAKVLQRAAQMREEKRAPRRVMSLFQRFALTFTMLLALLGSGTGLVGASSNALPGENLYPVKRTWEDVRLLLVFDPFKRTVLENEYEQERLHEAGELLAEKRDEEVSLAGVVLEQNGSFFISGLPVLPDAETKGALMNGATVMASGRTNAEGFIVLSSVEDLPPGSVVPLGQLLKGNAEDHDGYHLYGSLDAVQNENIIVNGQVVYLQNTEIEGSLVPGVQVKVEGYYAADGRFIATGVEVDDKNDD